MAPRKPASPPEILLQTPASGKPHLGLPQKFHNRPMRMEERGWDAKHSITRLSLFIGMRCPVRTGTPQMWFTLSSYTFQGLRCDLTNHYLMHTCHCLAKQLWFYDVIIHLLLSWSRCPWSRSCDSCLWCQTRGGFHRCFGGVGMQVLSQESRAILYSSRWGVVLTLH